MDIVLSEPGPVLLGGSAMAMKQIIDATRGTALSVYAEIKWLAATQEYRGVADISGKYERKDLRLRQIKIQPLPGADGWPTTDAVRQCLASGECFFMGRVCILNLTFTERLDGLDGSLAWSVVQKNTTDILAAGSVTLPVTVETAHVSGISGGG